MTRNARDPVVDGSDEPAEDPAGSTDDSAERRGSFIEFAIILALIAIVAFVALVLLDDALADLMSLVGDEIE